MLEKSTSNLSKEIGERHSYYFTSIFVQRNQAQILNVLEEGKRRFEALNGESENITWQYKHYNIFNLCAHSYEINKLQSITHQVIKLYLDEYEIKYEGFSVTAWLNYHTKASQLLKVHTHISLIHGYINIDPLESRTIMSDYNGNDNFYVENKVGLIYINQPNSYNLHRVEVNPDYIKDGDLIRPRVTLAFNIDIIPRTDNHHKIGPYAPNSVYNVFK